jgi:hypothetical protein
MVIAPITDFDHNKSQSDYTKHTCREKRDEN